MNLILLRYLQEFSPLEEQGIQFVTKHKVAIWEKDCTYPVFLFHRNLYYFYISQAWFFNCRLFPCKPAFAVCLLLTTDEHITLSWMTEDHSDQSTSVILLYVCCRYIHYSSKMTAIQILIKHNDHVLSFHSSALLCIHLNMSLAGKHNSEQNFLRILT